MDSLKRVTIGLIGGDINKKIVQILTQEYGLDRRNVTFKPLAPQEVRRAIQAKEIALLLVVAPLTDRYIALLRGVFSPNGKALPVLIPIETAGAIAERERAYESFDIPKGTLRGSPPSPADDVTTLRVPFYLVAKKDLGNDLVTTLTETLMNTRRDLIGEWPMLAQLATPDIEPDAYLPAHPGAATFYNGNQVSFLDKWGNLIFLVPMVLGGLVSIMAATRKYLREDDAVPKGDFLDHLYSLSARIRMADTVEQLDAIEDEIDRLLRSHRIAAAADDAEASNVTSINVAAHRLETLISDRRAALSTEASERQLQPRS
jgi:NMT1-like family